MNRFVASPAATAGAFIIVVIWALCGPAAHYSDGWQLIINTGTTIVTFLMVFVLNNAQARDTTAMNAKLDSIVMALQDADNRLVGLERKPESVARALFDEVQARNTGASCGIRVCQPANVDTDPGNNGNDAQP